MILKNITPLLARITACFLIAAPVVMIFKPNDFEWSMVLLSVVTVYGVSIIWSILWTFAGLLIFPIFKSNVKNEMIAILQRFNYPPANEDYLGSKKFHLGFDTEHYLNSIIWDEKSEQKLIASASVNIAERSLLKQGGNFIQFLLINQMFRQALFTYSLRKIAETPHD